MFEIKFSKGGLSFSKSNIFKNWFENDTFQLWRCYNIIENFQSIQINTINKIGKI